LPTRYRLEPDRTGRFSFFEPMSPSQDIHRPWESAVPHFWYLPARIACGFIALCRRDSTAPGRAGLIASDATPRSTRRRAFFDYARWEAVQLLLNRRGASAQPPMLDRGHCSRQISCISNGDHRGDAKPSVLQSCQDGDFRAINPSAVLISAHAASPRFSIQLNSSRRSSIRSPTGTGNRSRNFQMPDRRWSRT
jgi:hypothetical protein